MPRFNVQHPTTKEWRCFSTIVDDWITDWMDEKRYQAWREYEYGRSAGDVRSANRMSLDDAETIIREREKMEHEDDYDYERASDMRDYCERYEPTYNPEDGSM